MKKISFNTLLITKMTDILKQKKYVQSTNNMKQK